MRWEHEEAAYFFRYLEGWFRESGVTEQLLDYELSLIRSGSIDPLGKRFVAFN